MTEPLKTIGAMVAAGMDLEAMPQDLLEATPLNRADLRSRYYVVMPRRTRRKVFGRWRHKRVPYSRARYRVPS